MENDDLPLKLVMSRWYNSIRDWVLDDVRQMLANTVVGGKIVGSKISGTIPSTSVPYSGATPANVAATATVGSGTSGAPHADHQHAMGIVTTKGDLLGYGAGPTRHAVGADGTFLKADSAQADGLSWGTPAGFANPMTTQYDIIVGGASGTPTRKAKGANGTFLGVSGGVLDYYTPTGGSGNAISQGAYGSEPGSPATGDLYLPTDGFSVEDYSAAWNLWGPIFPLTRPPTVSNWTWVNQGANATATNSKGGVYLTSAVAETTNIRMLERSTPSTPYTISAGLLVNLGLAGGGTGNAGIGWRDSASGKLVLVEILTGSAGNLLNVSKWSSPTSFSASYLSGVPQFNGLWWLRIRDDGSSRYVDTSVDGQNWINIHSVTRTDFITPNQVVLFVDSNGSGYVTAANLLHWKEA